MTCFALPVRARVAVSAAALSALLGACTSPAEDVLYPVKLNPMLALESVDAVAIDARLAGPLWPSAPEEPGLEVYLFREDPWIASETPFEDLVIDAKLATNCIELKALTEAGYLGRYRNDRGAQWGLLKECEAIQLLRTARPAGVSFVRDFVLDADAVDVLPSMIDNGDLVGRLCEEYIANTQGVAWSAMDDIVEVEQRGDYDVVVWAQYAAANPEDDYPLAAGLRTNIRLLAWADFTGDGVEEMLFYTGSNAVNWSGPERELFFARDSLSDTYILRRNAPGAVLRVVDAERYLMNPAHQRDPCVVSEPSPPAG